MSELDQPDPEAVRDERVGTVLSDRYRLDALLGEGGMGKVYAAEHVMMRKKLAVKVLHRELTSVPEVITRFEREAMAAANIDHANVAAATDFGKLPDGSVFLVLEFVEGASLRDEIGKGAMPVERALHIARQIASALSAAHALDIVHRDLKPENIMLVRKASDPDFVKVLDFGIAKVPLGERKDGSAGPLTRAGMVFGTPEYMAPEQALGQNVDGRADLYALGVISYEMLTGVRPFSSKSQVGILGQQLAKPPPPFADRAPNVKVPKQAEQIVLKLLAKDPNERFKTAEEVVAALDELLRPPPGKGTSRFTLTGGSPTAVLGSIAQAFRSAATPNSAEESPPPVGSGASQQPARPGQPARVASAAQPGSPSMPLRKPPKGRVPPPPPTKPVDAPPPPPPPRAPVAPAAAPSAAATAEPKPALAPVVGKPTFLPSDPLPAFTLPTISTKADVPGKASEPADVPQPPSPPVVEGKPTFLPSDPLPAFTFPPVNQTNLSADLAGKLPVPLPRVESGSDALPLSATEFVPPQDLAAAAQPAPGTTGASAGTALLARGKRAIAKLGTNPTAARVIDGVKTGSANLLVIVRHSIAVACEWIDGRRSRLPPKLRTALKDIPAGAILAGFAGVLGGSLLLLIVIVALTSTDPKATEQAAKSAPAQVAPKQEDDPVLKEVESAKKSGLPALEKLAERHPKKAAVLLELAAAYAAQGQHASAVAAVGRALAADENAKNERLAADVLANAAREKGGSDAAFELLEGPMGASGAAVMYELSFDLKARAAARTRAETYIRSDEFGRAAAPEVQIAGALRFSRSCAEKHSLLKRAAEVGDKRALDYLKLIEKPGGCGRSARKDCFPCLRQDDALKNAIDAIEKRVGG